MSKVLTIDQKVWREEMLKLDIEFQKLIGNCSDDENYVDEKTEINHSNPIEKIDDLKLIFKKK